MFEVNVINVEPNKEIYGTLNGKIELSKRLREERLLSVVSQSKRDGFCVRFWEGVTGFKPQTNISKAHKQIVADAKSNNKKIVCIAEDDFILTSRKSWSYFNNSLPDDFDVYFGGVYSAELSGDKIVNGFSGMTLYVVHEKFYDFFLSANEDDHIDRWLGNFAHDKDYKICQPFVVKQIGIYSDNKKKHCCYEEFEKQWSYLVD